MNATRGGRAQGGGGPEGGDVQISLRRGQVPDVRVMLRECEARADIVQLQSLHKADCVQETKKKS